MVFIELTNLFNNSSENRNRKVLQIIIYAFLQNSLLKTVYFVVFFVPATLFNKPSKKSKSKNAGNIHSYKCKSFIMLLYKSAF